jgi:hypothetical protein
LFGCWVWVEDWWVCVLGLGFGGGVVAKPEPNADLEIFSPCSAKSQSKWSTNKSCLPLRGRFAAEPKRRLRSIASFCGYDPVKGFAVYYKGSDRLDWLQADELEGTDPRWLALAREQGAPLVSRREAAVTAACKEL